MERQGGPQVMAEYPPCHGFDSFVKVVWGWRVGQLVATCRLNDSEWAKSLREESFLDTETQPLVLLHTSPANGMEKRVMGGSSDWITETGQATTIIPTFI